jgi:cytochrome c oxidase subunit 2
MTRTLIPALALILAASCGSPQLYEPIPEGLDTNAAEAQTVEMTAQKYEFIPGVVTVASGTLVTLKITATDTTHGIAIPAFGIDVELPEGKTTEVEFYAGEAGEFDFECSHFCGMGHMGMDGKLVVE